MDKSLVTTEQVDALSRVSKAMVQSGYFQDARDVAQAFVKIQAGAELGLPPVASMTGIHIVKGRPVMGANLIATLIKNDPRYNYRVLEMTDAVCRIEFFEDGQACGISEFTAADAQRAGTQNMNKFPKNMLFARAISNGAKWYTPGIFGGVTIYTPEEMGADVNEDGDYITIDQPVIVERTPVPDTYSAADANRDLGLPANGNGKPQLPANLRRKLHAVGTDCYGDEWDDKRAAMSAAFHVKSSNDWTVEQANKVIDGMQKIISERVADQEPLFDDLTGAYQE